MEIADLVILLRISAVAVFLSCAAFSMRLLSLYKGSLLEEPWLPVIVGVVFLALNDLLVALFVMSPLFSSNLFLAFRSILALTSGIFLLVGLYRALKIWKTLHTMAELVLTARDKED